MHGNTDIKLNKIATKVHIGKSASFLHTANYCFEPPA